jgi:hypothetical protein
LGTDIETIRQWRKYLPLALILLLTIIFFYPVIFEDKTFYAFDALLQVYPWSHLAPDYRPQNTLITDPINIFYPNYHYYFNHVKDSILPWWYSLNFCGKPFPSGVFPMNNPVVFLVNLLFSLLTAHDVVLGLHLFAAGLFMFLYLRIIRLGILPALIGAVGWMFNGYVMVWFEFEHIPIMAATLPAALYYLHRWFETRTLFFCLCFTAAVALSITAGYSHVLIYELIFMAAYFIMLCFKFIKDDQHRWIIHRKDLLYLGLSVALGISISANFVTSSLILLDDPHRSEITYQDLYQETGQLPAKYLLTLIYPDFFGSPAGIPVVFTPRIKDAQPYNNYNELCIYAGVLPLFLVLACIPNLRKKNFAIFYLSTAAATLAMAMGSILYYPLAKWIIGLSYSTPTRILYIFGYCFVVLAAIGADILCRLPNKKKWVVFSLWILLLLTSLGLALFVQTEGGLKWALGNVNAETWSHDHRILELYFGLPSPTIQTPLIFTLLTFVSLTLVLFAKSDKARKTFMILGLMILALDLLSFAKIYNTAATKELAYPETGSIRYLGEKPPDFRAMTFGAFLHNYLAPFDVQEVGGYSSFFPKRFGEYLHLSQKGLSAPVPERIPSWTLFDQFSSPLINLLNTRYLLFPPTVKLDTPFLRLVYDNEIKIYENRAAFPRAFIVHGYEFCENRQLAYQRLGNYRQSDFIKKVILETLPPPDFRKQGPIPQGRADIGVQRIVHQPNTIEIDLFTDQNSFLVISNSYHPAWRATVDGRDVTVLRANYIMQAIPLKSGSRKVVLEFRPISLMAGFFITAAGWLMLAVLLGVTLFKRVRDGSGK